MTGSFVTGLVHQHAVVAQYEREEGRCSCPAFSFCDILRLFGEVM
ncbi:hypothetical protein OF868_15785 [Escherichia coli]|nr:hypothetical protein OF868_15785 [Escherichia coli]